MFEKAKKNKKKVFVGLAVVGGVVLLSVAYNKGVAKGAYSAGFYLGREVRMACDKGILAPGTDQKMLEILKLAAKGDS